MHKSAIVTLAIGPYFQDIFRRTAEESWYEYGARFGHEIIVLTEPLDNSPRAQQRSPAWQKCLVPSQTWAARYDRIVWLDSDIIINNDLAPDIFSHVPEGLIGGVTTLSQPPVISALRDKVLGPSYYSDYGLPANSGAIFNTGVLVYEPARHKPIFQHVYDAYEEREGNWHYEQRPLSWHIVNAGLAHSIDSRFNKIWAHDLFEFYPFLADAQLTNREDWITTCMSISAAKSYFFHFAGMQDHMRYCTLPTRATASQ